VVTSQEQDRARCEFSEKIRAAAGLRSEALVRAFATVRREDFVGPGPWTLIRPSALGRYEITSDADPRHLYEDVLIALDASRNLNNGQPSGLAHWLDSLDLTPGDRVLHIGCGVGYYTAIAAEAVGPEGRVVGVEIDRQLAERARRNLIPWPRAVVVSADGSEFAGESFNVIFVNAGATEVLAVWLDRLRDDGRLLIPLTVAVPIQNAGTGHMLLVVRRRDVYAARFISAVGIFHCSGARTTTGNDLLNRAFQIGGYAEVQSLRRDDHPRDRQCWLHDRQFCLSRLSITE
jgi:protein-L-isoaspartate(D-aspartate) O-methyltransferase